MDKTHVILLLCLVGIWTAQGLELNIYGPLEAPRILKEGKSMTLTCHLDMGLQVILAYKINWIHTPSFPVDAEGMKVTEQETLMKEFSPDHYTIKVDYKVETTNVTLTISKALSRMDGTYTCRATPTKEGDSLETLEKKVMVLVPSNIGSVQLNFDGEEVTSVSKVPVQREEGEVSVSCRTRNFHPAASLQMFLGDRPVETGDPEVSLDSDAGASAGARRRQAMLKVKKLKLSAADHGKTLKCVAKADFEGAVEKVASIPLEVIALKPVIKCDDNATGIPGDKYLRLTCHVDHSRVDVESYRFEIGDTGDLITPNKKSKKFDTVVVKNVSETQDDVTLVLYEACDWHFDTYYYLDVLLTNKQKFRVKAKLIKKDSTGGASRPAAYALCLLLVVLVWSL